MLAHPPSSSRRLLDEEGVGGGRRLLACGTTGCFSPKLDPAAIASASTTILLNFGTNSFMLFDAPYTTYEIAYGVCYAIGCNYRNVTVAFTGAGNIVGKNAFAYNVTFWAFPNDPALSSLPAALLAVLPSTSG